MVDFGGALGLFHAISISKRGPSAVDLPIGCISIAVTLPFVVIVFLILLAPAERKSK